MNWKLINGWLQGAIGAVIVVDVVNAFYVSPVAAQTLPRADTAIAALVDLAMEILYVLWCVSAYKALRAAGHSDRIATHWTALCWYSLAALNVVVTVALIAGGHRYDSAGRIVGDVTKVLGVLALILLLTGVRRLRGVVAERVAHPTGLATQVTGAYPVEKTEPVAPADEYW